MRGEVILLVAGLAVVAALPVQEQVPSSLQSDLLKIIFSANPGENDLHATADEKPSVALTKKEDQVTHTETVRQQTLPHPQDPPQSSPQNSPQEQPQVQDTPQEQPQVQDTPQEHPQVQDTPQEQPQVQDTPQEQPQVQDTPQEHPQVQDPPQEQPHVQDPPQEQPHVQDTPQEQPQVQDTPQEQPQSQEPEEPFFSYASEVEVPNTDSRLTVWPEPQPIMLYPQEESLPFEPEDPEGDELNSDLEMRTFLAESDDGYVVLQANEEQPSLDTEGTFIYGLNMTPLPVNQEEETFLSDPEEEYDSDEEALPFEPQMDSLPLELEEPQMKPLAVQSQEDTLPYDSAEYFDLNPQTDSFPLHEEPLESDYKQLSQEMGERPFNTDDYDYGYPMEVDQPAWEEDTPSSLENAPTEKLYHESQGETTVDLFSWLVPDFFDEDSTEYDESPYVTSYHDGMIDEDPFANKPEMHFESQVPDQTANWEETSTPEDFDDIVHSHDTFLEDGEGTVEVSETILPHEVGSMEEEDDNVSLADFFIPVYNDGPAFSDIPQIYSDSLNPEDGSEELVPLDDEENYSVDDGLFHSEPEIKHYHVDVKQDQPHMDMFGDDILFPENPSFEDEGYIFPWPAGNKEDQTEYSEDVEPVTILESQPTYGADVETDVPYPSIQERTLKEFVGGDLVEPWGGAKSLMVDLMTDPRTEDNEISPMEKNYVSDSFDNDAMDIIIVKDPRENFDSFPIRPLVDDIITHPMPTGRYTDDQRPKPYWVPQRIPDQQFPKTYFSIFDERPRRKTPTFFDGMDEDVSFSSPPSYHTLKTPFMRKPFTFLNEVMDDDLPPQYPALSSPSRQFRYTGPDTVSSPRNYPNEFKTAKFSFRDFLRNLNPSFYDDTPSNNIEKQSSPLYYPQSYNSLQHYNYLPQQFPRTLPPVTYSSPFDSFQERDNSPIQNYYTDRPQVLSFYSSNNEPSSLFREDTMPRMYSRQPQRHFNDYTDDLPYMSSDSFSSSRFRFPFFQRPQYPATSPVYMRPHYSRNSFYGMGPYYQRPMYHRYAPDYY